MTAAQGPSPEDPPKPFVAGLSARSSEPEDDEGFWDLDGGEFPGAPGPDPEAAAPDLPSAPFAKGEAPEVLATPDFTFAPLEPRELRADERSLVQTDVPHEPLGGKASRDVLLPRSDDAFAELEPGDFAAVTAEVQAPAEEAPPAAEPEVPVPDGLSGPAVAEAPVFAMGEAPSPAAEEAAPPAGFAQETLRPQSVPPRVVDLPKVLHDWTGGFSWVEKAWMLATLVLLGGFAALMFFPAIGSLPDEKKRAGIEDFPKQGKHLTVKSARTYWREPVEEGPEADVFKRGTALLPAIEMEVEGGSAALRILFRGEDGAVIGDSVTRDVKGGELVKVAGTEGFPEVGMHAAYRTGQIRPWMVQVYEAEPGSAQIDDFVLIFEMDMSARLK